MNITESEQIASLTATDINKLKNAKRGFDYLIKTAVLLLGGGVILAAFVYGVAGGLNTVLIIILGGYPLVIGGGLWPLYEMIRKRNALVELDLAAGVKNVVIAPIESKRIKSSDDAESSGEPESLAYLMRIRGQDYEMTEREYLTLKIGELIEIHRSPKSKIVLHQQLRPVASAVTAQALAAPGS